MLCPFFAQVLVDLVRGSLSGINASVFAYGQTATGKTYTLQVRTPPHPPRLSFTVASLPFPSLGIPWLTPSFFCLCLSRVPPSVRV